MWGIKYSGPWNELHLIGIQVFTDLMGNERRYEWKDGYLVKWIDH